MVRAKLQEKAGCHANAMGTSWCNLVHLTLQINQGIKKKRGAIASETLMPPSLEALKDRNFPREDNTAHRKEKLPNPATSSSPLLPHRLPQSVGEAKAGRKPWATTAPPRRPWPRRAAGSAGSASSAAATPATARCSATRRSSSGRSW